MKNYLAIMNLLITINCSKLEKNSELISSFQFGKKGNLNSLKINLGKETDFFISYDFTIFDFQFPKVILGNYEKLKWGINCDNTLEKEDNTCRTKNKDIKKCKYLETEYNYYNSEIFLYFTENDEISDIKNKLNFQLIEKIEGDWPLYKWGILGFSPQGDFSNYLRSNFENDISFLFYYSYNFLTVVESSLLSFKTRIVLNPIFEKEDIFFEVDFDHENRFWVFTAGFKMDFTTLEVVNSEICVSNNLNDLLIFEEAEEICEQIQKLACDGLFGDDCFRQNSDVRKISDLIFFIDGKDFSFEVKDFVFFDQKMNLKCRFKKRNDDFIKGCPENVKFAVGKIFFSKLFPILKYKNDGSSSLTFVTDYSFIKEQALFWSIVKIVFFFIIISIVIVFLLNRSKKDMDQFYTEI